MIDRAGLGRTAIIGGLVLLLVGCSIGAPGPTADPAATSRIVGSRGNGSPSDAAPSMAVGESPSGGDAGPPASADSTGAPSPSSAETVAPPSAEASGPPPTVNPSGAASEPLPACAYQDLRAVGDPDTDWSTMVLDTIYRLPADFAPRKLVSTSRAGLQSGYDVIPAVVDDLRAMHEASVAAGAEIAIRWAYRSYGDQQGAFAYWVHQSGKHAALQKSARPGHSEHQLGTAIDFRSADSLKPPWEYDDWATTAPGAWMLDNAWQYGFVLSYPQGKQDLTCYAYEPWHYRYVGRDLAAQIHASGLTPREYLWNLAHQGD